MRWRRDSRFIVLYVVSTLLWSVALYFARSRPPQVVYLPSPVVSGASAPPPVANEPEATAGRARARIADAPRPAGLPARCLGRGRCGRRIYWDVRDWSGQVRRYYSMTDRDSVVRTLKTIVLDLRDSEYFASQVRDDETSI